jgi:hypothetical protein
MEKFKFSSFNMVLRLFLYFIILQIVLSSCVRSDYEKLEEAELAKGLRRDSLFYSIKFGMRSSDYRAHCRKMNNVGVFIDGPANSAVEFNVPGMDHETVCYFTPQFFRDKIYLVSATFQYKSWAPWNRSLFSDSLQSSLIKLTKTWYPNSKSLIVTHPKKSDAFVMIEANRRVSIFIEDDRKVKIVFRDLFVSDKMVLDSLNRLK